MATAVRLDEFAAFAAATCVTCHVFRTSTQESIVWPLWISITDEDASVIIVAATAIVARSCIVLVDLLLHVAVGVVRAEGVRREKGEKRFNYATSLASISEIKVRHRRPPPPTTSLPNHARCQDAPPPRRLGASRREVSGGNAGPLQPLLLRTREGWLTRPSRPRLRH